MAKRVRCAVVESLGKRGFKPDGTSLDGSPKEIYGTAQFLPGALALKLPYADIVRQTDTVIEWIIKVGSKSHDSRSVLLKGDSKGQKREVRLDQQFNGHPKKTAHNRNYECQKKFQKSQGGEEW